MVDSSHAFVTQNEVSFWDSSYMRGRLTLEKVNAAVNDMATYAEATSQLVSAPRKKVHNHIYFQIYSCFLFQHLVYWPQYFQSWSCLRACWRKLWWVQLRPVLISKIISVWKDMEVHTSYFILLSCKIIFSVDVKKSLLSTDFVEVGN